MIDQVGLIEKGNAAQIPFAYELYMAINLPEPDMEKLKMAPSANNTMGATVMMALVVTLALALGSGLNGPCGVVLSFVLWYGLNTGRTKKGRETQKRSEDIQVLEMARHFKETFSRSVRVHFVGAWDTVSSVGIVRENVLPFTAKGMKHVCFFRHALALDERRVKFLPEYACGGTSETIDTAPRPPEIEAGRGQPAEAYRNIRRLYSRSVLSPPVGSASLSAGNSEDPPHTKEVWFAGTHSDIGGGNTDNLSMDYSGPPLRWMSYEAISAGLRMKPFRGQWSMDKLINVNESLMGLWRVFEYLPLKRLSYTDPNTLTLWPNRGAGRQIQPSQRLHSSIFLAKWNKYTPYARFAPLDGKIGRNAWIELRNAWDRMRDGNKATNRMQGRQGNDGDGHQSSDNLSDLLDGHQVVLESDLYDFVADLVARCTNVTSITLPEVGKDLRYALSTQYGRRALLEVPKATQRINAAFWEVYKSESILRSSETTDSASITVSVEPDIDMFGILFEHDAEWPHDRHKVTFASSSDIRDAVFQLQLQTECITVKLVHSIGPPSNLKPLSKLLSLKADIDFPITPSALHSFVHEVDHFLWHLHNPPETGSFRDAIEVEFIDLNSYSRHIRERDQVKLEVRSEWAGTRSMYGITISNTHSMKRLYLAVITFRHSKLSIKTNYRSPEQSTPLKPGQSLAIGMGIGVPLSFHLTYGKPYDIAYLKIYLSTSYIDPSSIPDDEWNSRASASSSRGNQSPPDQDWDTLVIPMALLPKGALTSS